MQDSKITVLENKDIAYSLRHGTPVTSLQKPALKVMDEKQMKRHNCIIPKPLILCAHVTKTNTNRTATIGVSRWWRQGGTIQNYFQSVIFVSENKYLKCPTKAKMKTWADLRTFDENMKHWLKQNHQSCTCAHTYLQRNTYTYIHTH